MRLDIVGTEVNDDDEAMPERLGEVFDEEEPKRLLLVTGHWGDDGVMTGVVLVVVGLESVDGIRIFGMVTSVVGVMTPGEEEKKAVRASCFLAV